LAKPILVVHERASRLIAAIEGAGVRHERFVGVDRIPEIPGALRTYEPNVVLCIKNVAFLGPEFRALVAHPTVRWVNVGGSGVEHLGPWDRDRVTVTNSAGVLAPYLAESWVGAVVALDGGLLEQAAARTWGERKFRSLRGQRLLLVGLGEIGRRIAVLAEALGMVVEAVRAHPSKGGAPLVVGPERLDERLGEADVVSLHMPLNERTRGTFDRARLERIKRGALFVNTARGGLVDEAALTELLSNGHLRAAWLDVFETEPLPDASPLWSLDNVLITPHAADQAQDWDLAFVDRFVAQLARWRAGEPLLHVC
jgi:phosphoglycerate dehydrogenase-like enzyme